jgi:hypothetical protein
MAAIGTAEDSARALPQFSWVRQHRDAPSIGDVRGAVDAELRALDLGERVRPGDTVAVASGSRGIARMAEVVAAVVDQLKALGAKPFVVPAMGSHAGGTAEGQTRMLAEFGITETTVGCEVRASMDVVELFQSKLGVPVYFDRVASEADHVVVCNRVKPHTLFHGQVESGLCKMLLVGLGKQAGAATCHHAFAEHGFSAVLDDALPTLIERSKLLAGVAVVENAIDEPALIAAIAPDELFEREAALLIEARGLMATLPFDDIDVLLIDRIGKNISGGGLDNNVVGRKMTLHEPDHASRPRVRYIVVRGLTDATHGNAMGVGLAELCRTRVLDEMDVAATWLNAITAGDLPTAMAPIHYDTDTELLATALTLVALRPASDVRILWIANTLHLSTVAASEALVRETVGRDDLEVVGAPWALPIGADGNLPDDLPLPI